MTTLTSVLREVSQFQSPHLRKSLKLLVRHVRPAAMSAHEALGFLRQSRTELDTLPPTAAPKQRHTLASALRAVGYGAKSIDAKRRGSARKSLRHEDAKIQAVGRVVFETAVNEFCATAAVAAVAAAPACRQGSGTEMP